MKILFFDIAPLDYEFHYYGASKNLFRSFNTWLPSEKVSKKINWPHGWVPNHETQVNSVGRILMVFQDKNPPYFNLVATKKQEQLLITAGFSNSKSIGHPFIYSKSQEGIKLKNSLLVMPIHSSSGEEFNGISFNNFVDEIVKIKNKFETIDIVIHPNDIRQGYWVNEFNNNGFNIIEGFEAKDMKSGLKMRKLFSRYEFMTTNGFGSHIVFASYCGLKVSLSGKFAENRIDEKHHYVTKYSEYHSNNHYFYNGKKIIFRSEDDMRINFPFLFCDPWNAKTNVSWAEEELGEMNKISKQELVEIIYKIKKNV